MLCYALDLLDQARFQEFAQRLYPLIEIESANKGLIRVAQRRVAVASPALLLAAPQ